MPAKNSEAIFWRPRFTWPLRAGKRANARFACSEGFFLRPACRAVCRGGRSCAACRCCGGFCARCPVFFLPVCRCLVPGLRLSAVFCLACAACLPFGRRRLCFRLAGSLPLLCLARAAGACLPFARRALCVHGFSLLFFLFPASLLPLKNLFHLSLRPRRASTFFRKESRQRFARGRGSAPFEPPFLRPAANLFLFRAAGRLSGPSGRKPPADRETLEKPRSRAQLFKRFCAKGDACALWLNLPLPLAAGRLKRPFGPQTAGRRGKRPKSQRSKAQLFPGVSVRGGCAGAFARRVSSRLQGTGARISVCLGEQKLSAGLNPESSRVCVRLGKATNPVRVLPAAGAGFLPARENRSSVRACTPKAAACVRDVGKKKTGSANCPPQVCANCSARAFCLPGKTEAVRGPAPATNRVRGAVGQRNKPGARFAHRRCACVRGWVQTQTRYANCPAQPRVSFRPQGTGAGLSLCLGKQKLSAGAHSETAAGVRGWAQTTNPVRGLPGAAAGFLPAAGNRGRAFALLGKTKAQRGRTLGNSRGACEAGRRHKPGARFAHRRRKSSAKLCGEKA